MVLAELGGRITAAMRNMTAHTVIDEEAVDVMLKEIASVRPPPNPEMAVWWRGLRRSCWRSLELSGDRKSACASNTATPAPNRSFFPPSSQPAFPAASSSNHLPAHPGCARLCCTPRLRFWPFPGDVTPAWGCPPSCRDAFGRQRAASYTALLEFQPAKAGLVKEKWFGAPVQTTLQEACNYQAGER